MQELCDGDILTSPEAYEPEGTEQMRKWMKGTGRDVWCLGPLLPLQKQHHGLSAEKQLSENAHEIQHFMDKVLAESGEKSLLYVRSPWHDNIVMHTDQSTAHAVDFPRLGILAIYLPREAVGIP